jgi:hypothetical protein
MTIKITIKNAAESSVMNAEMESTDSVGDILDYAAQYWNSDRDAYVMKIGSRLIPANATVGELGLSDGDTVVIVPDPQGG